MDFLKIPRSPTYRITNVAIPGFLKELDDEFVVGEISIHRGKFSAGLNGESVDAGGAIILPTFTDMHTHLDKGHIWPRAPNPDGTFDSALAAVASDRETNWHAKDVEVRIDFSLRCAWAHGTKSIRTHLDSAPPQHRISWPVFREMRERWSGRIDLQAVTIIGIDAVERNEQFEDVAAVAAESGGILGCVTYPVPDLENRIEIFFETAAKKGMSADFHIDETKNPNSATLRVVAQKALEMGFDAPIVAGHCCSLANQTQSEADRTLDLVAEAGINVVSLPMCNSYLQDREVERTPRWRGVTLVHEMRSRGIPVSFASDNTRDPFYAYGDLDMLEVVREATRICHLDHSASTWLDAFTTVPSRVCGFSENRLAVGEEADFVLFQARDWSELLARPHSDRVVVRNGAPIDRSLPKYSELDRLMELR